MKHQYLQLTNRIFTYNLRIFGAKSKWLVIVEIIRIIVKNSKNLNRFKFSIEFMQVLW